MKQIGIDEGFFEGAVSFEKGAGWIRPWRIPFEQRYLFPGNDGPYEYYAPYIDYAAMPSGVRLRFGTDSAVIALALAPEREGRSFDVTIDGDLIDSVAVAANYEMVTFENLPSGRKTVEIWLPQNHPTAIKQVLIDDSATLETVADERPKWITYGSSITHCMEAHSPARTWPAIVARDRDYNLTSLGYAGNCHLEPMVARLIRDLPADFISLKVGINIVGAESLSLRTLQSALIGFVEIIREKHADTPLAVVSPVWAKPREMATNNVGLNLTIMRDQVREVVEYLRGYGDVNAHYFDGRDLLGFEQADDFFSEDEVHPTADGYELIGRNFLKVVFERITV